MTDDPINTDYKQYHNRFCFPPAGQEKDERGVGEQDAGDTLNVMVKIMCYCILQLSCWWQTVGNINSRNAWLITFPIKPSASDRLLKVKAVRHPK